MTASAPSERKIVLLVAMVQLVNIVDFMMVIPLGPFFAKDLGVAASQVGLVAGAYPAAAVISGLVGSVVLDRFGRRRALVVSVVGMVLGTAAASLATGLAGLVAARAVAGLFGGPATSVSMAIVTDAIAPQRRGRAMGSVMAAFSVASVLGVPAGLVLAQQWGWRAPFLVVALAGLVMAVAVAWMLPEFRAHLERPATPGAQRTDSSPDRGAVLLSMLAVASNMGAAFALVPNLPVLFINNRGFPAQHISLLYLFGGLASFVAMRVAGVWVDRRSASQVAWAGTGAVALALLGLITDVAALPVGVLFVMFMLGMALRNVASRTLTSKVPSPAGRARFMSGQSVMQHLGSALGAVVSAWILSTATEGHLVGFGQLALVVLVTMMVLPFALMSIQARVDARQSGESSPGALAGPGKAHAQVEQPAGGHSPGEQANHHFDPKAVKEAPG